MKKIILTMFALLIVCSFSSCDSSSENFASEENTASTEKDDNDNSDSTGNITDSQTIGYWEITINSAESIDKVKNSNWEFAPAKGNKFVVINADVKNTGDDAHAFLPYMVIGNSEISAKLVCNETEYRSTELMGYSAGLNKTTIAPSEFKNGNIIFEVPGDTALDSTDMELVFTLGDDTCSFSIFLNTLRGSI